MIIAVLNRKTTLGPISNRLGFSSSTFELAREDIQRIRAEHTVRPPWTQSILQLHDLISSSSILRMHFQLALRNSQDTLGGMDFQGVIDLLNRGIHCPPAFTTFILVAAPVNSILTQMMQQENGRALFSHDSVNSALREVFSDYNKFIRSAPSRKYLTEEEPYGWFSPSARKLINYSDYVIDSEQPFFGFNSWNDWFVRRLRPGARPVDGANDPGVIVNTCEATPLEEPTMPVRGVTSSSSFWLKSTAYSLKDIFGRKQPTSDHYSTIFEGGTVYQGFLNPFAYHHWHAPVTGTIEKAYLIQGHYLLDASQFYQEGIDSLKDSEHMLPSVATRKVVIFDTHNPLIGKVTAVYVGMADISSCILTVRQGDRVQKGQDIGHFELGGSSHVLIFEERANLAFSNSLYSNGTGAMQKINSKLAHVL